MLSNNGKEACKEMKRVSIALCKRKNQLLQSAKKVLKNNRRYIGSNDDVKSVLSIYVVEKIVTKLL